MEMQADGKTDSKSQNDQVFGRKEFFSFFFYRQIKKPTLKNAQQKRGPIHEHEEYIKCAKGTIFNQLNSSPKN